MDDDTCDVCAGTGNPVSGLPCVCGGTGRGRDEKIGLRKQAISLALQLEELKRRCVVGGLVIMPPRALGEGLEDKKKIEALESQNHALRDALDSVTRWTVLDGDYIVSRIRFKEYENIVKLRDSEKPTPSCGINAPHNHTYCTEKRVCDSAGPTGLRCEREKGHDGPCAGGRVFYVPKCD